MKYQITHRVTNPLLNHVHSMRTIFLIDSASRLIDTEAQTLPRGVAGRMLEGTHVAVFIDIP